MSPGEYIAAATLLFTVFGAIFLLGQRLARLEEQLKAMPSAIKTERRLTRIETLLHEVAKALHVDRPHLADDELDK